MPDQTAAGRLSGVHGEDEVLEINTWGGASGGVDRWPNNMSINGGSGIGSVYNGSGVADEYGYGSGSLSSGTLPSGCSGLVLRAEDFIEWVRGGLMNNDDENEDIESDDECSELEGNDGGSDNRKPPKQEDGQHPELLPLTRDIKGKNKCWQQEKFKTWNDDENKKVILESTVIQDVVKNEQLNTDILNKKKNSSSAIVTDLVTVKKEQEEATITVEKRDGCNKDYCSKSAVDEAVEAERFPLAAAKFKRNQGGRHRHHCHRRHRGLNCESLVNGGAGNNTNIIAKNKYHRHSETAALENKVDIKRDNDQKCYCCCCKRRRQSNLCSENKTKTFVGSGSSNKQQLVVMSYSRYCRYRAQLQRRREEDLSKGVDIADDKEKTGVNTYRGIDTMNTTRVLFCRDTYDYPAELLLQPFNMQENNKQNSAVLVSHMAPKLKGWPSYPASWMSFRWNRVRRRLRHMERGSGSNDDQRRRRRRRKLKKKSHQRQNGASGLTVAVSYSSSTEDDDTDSDEVSSATNDGATNTTTTASTSDSDGAPPASSMVKTANKNHSATTTKVNCGVHHSKKNLSSVTVNNMIVINGATTNVPVTATNKRSAVAIRQPSQQQPTKRRRFVYSTDGQSQYQHQQQVIYQQQQQNQKPRQPQHMLVQQQQQQKIQSFNRNLPKSLSSLQSSTRVIHHHLPPSVTIMPVMVPPNMATQQQQHRLNKQLPNRQKQLNVAAVISAASQRRNTNSERQMPLPPVIIQYDNDDNQEYVSDNGRFKKSTVAEAMAAACQKRVDHQDFEGEQRQQREEEERQRRWLVDALRLGGLEVTAVPSNVCGGSGNNSGGDNGKNVNATATTTSQQQRRRQYRQRDVSFETMPTNNERYNGSVIVQNERRHSDKNPNLVTNSDSVMMTVTPDVICLLNKSREQQASSSGGSPSTASESVVHHQQRRRSVNSEIGSSGSQHYNQVSATAATAAVLHDKINRAIDSLKQQQQHQGSNTSAVSVSNSSSNVMMMGGSNHHHINNDNNSRQQDRRRKMSVYDQRYSVVGGKHHPEVVPVVGRQTIPLKMLVREQQFNVVSGQHRPEVVPVQQQQTATLLDLSVKPIGVQNTNITRQQKHLLPTSTMNSNLQKQHHQKSLSPFQSTTMTGSSTAATNLEITIVPVASSTTNNASILVTQQQQQKRSSVAVPSNLISGTKTLSTACSSSPMTVRQQLQQRNAAMASTTTASASIIDMLCSNGSLQHQQRSGISVTATTSQQQQQQQQQQQILLLRSIAASAMAAHSAQHQEEINKRKSHQNRKD